MHLLVYNHFDVLILGISTRNSLTFLVLEKRLARLEFQHGGQMKIKEKNNDCLLMLQWTSSPWNRKRWFWCLPQSPCQSSCRPHPEPSSGRCPDSPFSSAADPSVCQGWRPSCGRRCDQQRIRSDGSKLKNVPHEIILFTFWRSHMKCFVLNLLSVRKSRLNVLGGGYQHILKITADTRSRFTI